MNHDKFIPTPEFNKQTKENFDKRLKQGKLANIYIYIYIY